LVYQVVMSLTSTPQNTFLARKSLNGPFAMLRLLTPLLAAPLAPFLGLPFSYGLISVSFYVLTGIVNYKFAFKLTVSEGVALISSLLFLMTFPMIIYGGSSIIMAGGTGSLHQLKCGDKGLRMNVLAEDYVKRAGSRLTDAKSALERGDYPEVVRYSQEAVELSLKACLRLIGVEYPKVHDVGDVLKLYPSRFPAWMRGELNKLAEISRDLAEKRAPSMYGVEALGKPASQLFTLREAGDALEKAKYVHAIAFKLLKAEVDRSA